MPAAPTIFNDGAERDFDTLGSRLSRAREAIGQTSAQLARSLAVKRTTVEGWESDRAEPRANQLVRLAGVLGVSPSWLLFGVGAAPIEDGIATELRQLSGQIAQLRELRDRSDAIIAAMEGTISRAIRHDRARAAE